MRIRGRILWLVLALVVVVAGAGAWWWTWAHQAAPQIITLPNGERYEFAGTTYGTKDVPPSLPAKLVSWLPTRLATAARKSFGAQISQVNMAQKFEQPRLFVWFRRLGANAPALPATRIITARLCNGDGVEAGVTDHAYFDSGNTWSFAAFSVVPKRSRVIQCNLYDLSAYRSPRRVNHVSFPNPLYGKFPQWQPEPPLPAMKRAGDLEVRLPDLTTTQKLGGLGTWFALSLDSPKGASEGWVVDSSELSDATGNILRDREFPSGRLEFRPSTMQTFSGSLRETLWPDESAWRLKLQFKRGLGFDAGEVVTFTNVPVPAMWTTNTTHITNTVGGIQVVLTEFFHGSDTLRNGSGYTPGTSRIRVELPGKPAGMALDFLNMTIDAATTEPIHYSPLDSALVIFLQSMPTNAHTADITWVVQKTRTVEFMIKPPSRNEKKP